MIDTGEAENSQSYPESRLYSQPDTLHDSPVGLGMHVYGQLCKGRTINHLS